MAKSRDKKGREPKKPKADKKVVQPQSSFLRQPQSAPPAKAKDDK